MVSKSDAERARAYYQRNRCGAVSVTDVEVSATSVEQFVMWGYVPDDLLQRPKSERKALIKQAVNRFLNEDLQHLREPPASPADGKPLAAPKAGALNR